MDEGLQETKDLVLPMVENTITTAVEIPSSSKVLRF
jgi:hypothetical protein